MKNFKLFLYVLISIILFTCCSKKDTAKLKITDFSKTQTVVLQPYKFFPYTMINIKVKGYVNDTIKIIQGPDLYDINLSGDLDTIRKIEYYGEGPRTFIFDPYKATQGELEIEFQL
ncbi:hypothetical protein SAMN05444483_12711 [Salegentibacter echinorum]|uniref:Lipoprotein n=1 Tax=Salegentibacter echinorum TaxID=1073325 RepID=A0A1M5MEN8_SALEC|nr:hypothetical protein [Salegentibacter echinorum]SHG75183.1 hypothetical protein SAMN05444483_12711 [Salegentibacter echinorum]